MGEGEKTETEELSFKELKEKAKGVLEQEGFDREKIEEILRLADLGQMVAKDILANLPRGYKYNGSSLVGPDSVHRARSGAAELKPIAQQDLGFKSYLEQGTEAVVANIRTEIEDTYRMAKGIGRSFENPQFLRKETIAKAVELDIEQSVAAQP